MTREPVEPLPPDSGRLAPVRPIECLILLLVSLYLIAGHRIQLSQWSVQAEGNTCYAEALAWHEGRLDIPNRVHDSALYRGKVYSVHPPLFSIISWGVIGLLSLQGLPCTAFYTPWYVAIVALPLPFLAFAAIRRATGSDIKSAFLALGWLAGSPVLPSLLGARDGTSCSSIDHLLSQTGLMLMTLGLLGRRRLFWAMAGWVIAVLSRPTTGLYIIALVWAAWQWDVRLRRRRLIGLGFAILLGVGPMALLNALKFDSPFEAGYKYLYEGRIDRMAERGRHAIVSPEYISENAWYMNAEIPGWEIGAAGLRPRLDSYGASMWFTTPLLLYVLFDLRRWWRDPLRRWLVMISFGIIAWLLCYHNTGYIQPGYYRFMLDFGWIWLIAIAPDCWGRLRTRLTVAAVTWSLLYFNVLAVT